MKGNEKSGSAARVFEAAIAIVEILYYAPFVENSLSYNFSLEKILSQRANQLSVKVSLDEEKRKCSSPRPEKQNGMP